LLVVLYGNVTGLKTSHQVRNLCHW